MRLLLVEDDAGVRESMQDVLAEVGEVQAAASVSEALAALAREPFALALTDLHLDTRGGARHVLLAARRALVPVAVVSAAPAREVLDLLAPEAPDARLAKPFNIEDLLALAEHYLQLWRRLEEQGEPLELRPGLPPPVLAPGMVRVVSGVARLEGQPLLMGYLTQRQLAALAVDAPALLRYVVDDR